MAVLSSFLLKVFIVLGMYNFERAMKFRLLLVRMMSEWLMSIGQYFGMKFIKKGNLRRAIQKHEWMPRMLPTHSTLPPSSIEKVILSLSYEEMTRKIYSKASRYTASRSADLGDTQFLIGFQKHEWMPRMLPTHSTLPPSATEKVILSLSFAEMTHII